MQERLNCHNSRFINASFDLTDVKPVLDDYNNFGKTSQRTEQYIQIKDTYGNVTYLSALM